MASLGPHITSEQEINKIKNKKNTASANTANISSINKMLDLLSQLRPSNEPEFIDNRVQPYELDTFPSECDIKKCKEHMRDMYENTRAIKYHFIQLKTSNDYREQYPMETIRRLGSNLPQTLMWYELAKRNQARDINTSIKSIAYDPRMLHSYSNQLVKAEILTPGSTHVAVGFTDLSMFFTARFLEELSEERPLKWVGYEAAAYSVAKFAVVVAMMEMNAEVDQILQVWYSASWSEETLKAFKKAVEFLINSKLGFFFLNFELR